MASRLTVKSQVTVPKRIREALGIGPGSAIEFEFKDGDVVLRAAGAPRRRPILRAIEDVRGIAGPGPSTDELMAMLRGDDAA